ncbi:hydroxysteroid 11-beta-dehydrogenase 1-like protein A [Bolinopsis microptera]|uniref:hydroxysteroid 11-beta-dehydrogenase 1-like protein A n=1 Tax=Bolinopsis microptera TaxID=2820187 RepID=UPI003078B13B
MNYKVPCILLLISVSLYYLLSPAPPLSDEQLTTHLKDKVVLICGASSGIGEELAYQLAGHGAKLVLVARNQDKLDVVKEGVVKLGATDVQTISFDFSDVKGSSGVINQTIAWFGKLDYLVSNHAAMGNSAFLGFPYRQEPDFIEKIFRVNLFSHIELAVHALPHLEASKGHMLFTSSMAGEAPLYRMSIYCSTKHGMNGFFYSLQQELMARESPVSLTIGSVGYIATKDLSQIVAGEGMTTPAWATGDVKECARGMIESYITRPPTMTYPKLYVYVHRAMWYILPVSSFHKTIIQIFKPPGTVGTGYQEALEFVNKGREIAKKLNFQQGYGPDDGK